ncbi:triacylglycerol lipase 2-like [Papaver somniferum]|uniref:triacylglycerol lipase 2-like n=1 Tax=Papaver somniferum TaxID=3469 RepID=UPI000E6FB5F8|nr:triacylglycerol lipase 2-like [Papaver somniferum]
MAQYDLPAYINFVYKQTKKEINYIGHSQGTIIALASFSLGRESTSEIVSKLKAAAVLSPVAYLSNMLNEMSRVEFASSNPMAEVNTADQRTAAYLGGICKSVQGMNCFDMVSSFTGKNCCLNATSFDKFIANSPQSTSAKNSMHLAQTNSGKFTKYDYGIGNMLKYGQTTPPLIL